MLIVDLYKYWHEQEEGAQRQIKRKKLQLFNPVIKANKSSMGIGNIVLTFDVAGDSERINELETNAQIYSLGTVWDTRNDKKFDFYADRVDVDNNEGKVVINGFSLTNLFNTQLRFDFSRKCYAQNGQYHSPNLLEIWQELKRALIERDKLINSYFWEKIATFKNTIQPKGNLYAGDYEILKSEETNKLVSEYCSYTGQNFVVNIWHFLRPLLVYCGFKLDMWLDEGLLNLKLVKLQKDKPVGSLNEFTDILKVEDFKPKYNIVEATIKYQSAEEKDEWVKVDYDKYREEDSNRRKTEIVYSSGRYETIKRNPSDEEKAGAMEITIKTFDGDIDSLETSYNWERFNFPKDKPVLIKSGFMLEWSEDISSGECEEYEEQYTGGDILLKWTQNIETQYFAKVPPIVTERNTQGIKSLIYAIDSEDNRIKRINETTNISVKLPYNLAYFEEKTLQEAQTKAILTLAKNLYSYRITYKVEENRFDFPLYIGAYLQVLFFGKLLTLPIIEIQYENINNSLQETIILGTDLPELEELMANSVKNGAEIKV